MTDWKNVPITGTPRLKLDFYQSAKAGKYKRWIAECTRHDHCHACGCSVTREKHRDRNWQPSQRALEQWNSSPEGKADTVLRLLRGSS